jgi:diaminohydroxyphosphoribosylaminopyrimidine deaminase/5-amino-6-(5-phosphoribosylamino)uracil reductase
MNKKIHSHWMDRATLLAWKGCHTVQSNPMVGAVLVQEGKKIGEGYHRFFGGAHAEVEAIRDAFKKGHSTIGAQLYVTLEPCCHTGKQGPCTEAIREAGISRVFYAQKDPHPLVAGKGTQWLQKNRIPTTKIVSEKTHRLNEIYLTNNNEKRPFIHLKVACTQDFKITLKKGTRSALSGKKSQERLHHLRNRVDAIMIGIQTLLIDDPRLTTRLPNNKGHSPIRIILDSHLQTPATAQIFKEKGETWILTLQKQKKIPSFPKSTQILICKKNKEGQIDLKNALKKLFHKGIRSVLVEGGMQVNTSFLEKKWVDRLTLILTPHWSHDKNAPALFNPTMLPLELESVKIEKIAEDTWMDARLINNEF